MMSIGMNQILRPGNRVQLFLRKPTAQNADGLISIDKKSLGLLDAGWYAI
jgi:hypothetical protein